MSNESPLQYNATVVSNELMSDHLAILKVKPDRPLSEFKAGQFAVLGLVGTAPCAPNASQCKIPDEPQKLIRKAYSIASAGVQTDTLEFYIALVPEGELTPRLFHLKAGDRLFIGTKITGKFTLDSIPVDKNLILVSTGTGLAPFLSMVRTDMICGHVRHFVVIHGARHSSELGYYNELSLMAQNCKNFHYLPTVSRPTEDANWGGLKGRVTDVLTQGVVEKATGLELSPEYFHVLLCGSPNMVEDISIQLEAKGFRRDTKSAPGNIHKEEYW